MNTILELPRGRDTLVVAVREYEGRRFADLRIWYTADGELRPGKAGLTLKADAIGPVVDALRQAERLLRDGEG